MYPERITRLDHLEYFVCDLLIYFFVTVKKTLIVNYKRREVMKERP
jgi:hypothetical protein